MKTWLRRHRRREIDAAILRLVSGALPEQFQYVKDQVAAGVVRRIREDADGVRQLSYDSDLLNRFEDKRGRWFAIDGIRVGEVPVTITVCYGVVVDFSHETSIDHTNPVDASDLRVRYLDSAGEILLLSRVSPDVAALINPADVYEIEVKGAGYLCLRDLSDGAVLAADQTGALVFLTLHPFGVEPADESWRNTQGTKANTC